MPRRLGVVRREHVQVAARIRENEAAMLVPPRFPYGEGESRGLERRKIGALVGGIGHDQVDVDHGLGRQAGHRCGADVGDAQSAVTERRANAPLQLAEHQRPTRIRVDERDLARRRRTADPGALARRCGRSSNRTMSSARGIPRCYDRTRTARLQRVVEPAGEPRSLDVPLQSRGQVMPVQAVVGQPGLSRCPASTPGPPCSAR